MSQENAEFTARVRRGFDAYNRGDFDAAMEQIHPEIELVPAGGQSPISGAAAYRAWMEPDAFESQVLELLEVRFNGNKALIRVRSTIRGAGSGIEADFLAWMVWTMDEDGRARRQEIYLYHEEAEALEAAGLSEQAVSQENVEIVRRGAVAVAIAAVAIGGVLASRRMMRRERSWRSRKRVRRAIES